MADLSPLREVPLEMRQEVLAHMLAEQGRHVPQEGFLEAGQGHAILPRNRNRIADWLLEVSGSSAAAGRTGGQEGISVGTSTTLPAMPRRAHAHPPRLYAHSHVPQR